jgi:eukaryotic-like serine/threonine-protein kinase
MQFWNELEGRTIDGRHPLRRLVRSEGRSAWFETELGDPQRSPATISLTEALTDADEVSARLQAAQSLKHPNLVTVSKVGQVNLDNTLFVYAVMEHIEQSLSDVLEGQALSPEEAREVAEALVGSLTAIHQKGMSHGHVEAASVLATEETVKLRSDCLQMTAASQAEDVAGIGATLFHAFTQRKGLSATDAQINRIPAPFAEIVRNSFARRWTLAQVANALKPVVPIPDPILPTAAIPQPAPVVAKVPEKAPPVVSRPPAPAVAPEKPRAAVIAQKPIAEKVVEQEPFDQEEVPIAAKGGHLGLYLGLAVAVLAILAWLVLRPGSTPAPAQGANPQAPAQAAAPATPPPAPVAPAASPAAKKPSAVVPATTRAPKPQPTSTTAAAPVDRTAIAATAGNGRPIWRVIAYTYRQQEQATAMVASISAKHPNLKVEVFSPHGKSDIYLVCLGGGDMDRAEAAKMLDKVRSMGLPDDTYIQNFAE